MTAYDSLRVNPRFILHPIGLTKRRLANMALSLAIGCLAAGRANEAKATQPSSGTTSNGSNQVQLSGNADRNGASSSSKKSSSKKKSSKNGANGNSKFPELVYGGNAVSFVSPLQIGVLEHEPRLRFGFQYDRQWHKSSWLYVGAAALFDRGDFTTFKMSECGLQNQQGACGKGAVAGFDLWAGYAYKVYLESMPYIVPIVRAGGGLGYWKYPNLGGSRQQDRISSLSFFGHVGGGLRIFVKPYLGVGLDVNAQIGVNRHTETPLNAPLRKTSGFLIGIQVLPLMVEYRF